MAEFPALPIFIDAYLADTIHLTAAEHGVYLMMLMMAWRDPNCSVPNDDDWICRFCRVHGNAWRKMKPVILSFWKEKDGRLFQQRLMKEREYVEEKSKKSRSAARERWKEFHSKPLINNNSKDAGAMRTQCQTDAPTPTPTPTPIKDSPPTPSKPVKEIPDAKPKRKSTTVADDFQPDLDGLRIASELGFINGSLENAVREFIDYWKSDGGTKVDWQATFRNRLRKLAEYRAERDQRKTDGRRNVQDVTGATLRAIQINQSGKT
jgi:uncharacterized protein YdaU (DUF1376 family)